MMRFTRLLALLLPGLAFGQDLEDVYSRAPRQWPIPASALSAKSALEQGDSRIDPGLRALLSESRSKSIGELDAVAKQLNVILEEDRVAVRLHADDPASTDALRTAVEDQGGEVTGTVGNVVLARVRLSGVEKLGGAVGLYFMANQAQFFPDSMQSARRVSEGVGIVKVGRLHQRGITGKGVKVGIIDFGYQGYSKLLSAGRVPQPKAQQAFNRARQMEVSTVHGTACAEIIHDMAPDAELYLAAIDGAEDQIVQSAVWLISQGVDIISFSGGGPFGPSDGRATTSLLVDAVVQKGVLWVNAAGNEGSSHWSGASVDRNRDGFIEVDQAGANSILLQPKTSELFVLVKWDDWGSDPSRPSSTQDIDLFLFQLDPSTRQFQLVAQSTNPQNGRGMPIEGFRAKVEPGSIFAVVMKAQRLTRQVKIHLYAMAPAALKPAVAAGSISNPATARMALAVGAVSAVDGRLEAFSSQGPTDDNRLKPELAGPDNNTSAAYSGRFPGTSAACPHVAGFAALVKQMQPTFAGLALRDQLVKYTRPMGQGPNNQTGHGHIDAETIGGGGGEAPPPSGGGGPGQITLVLPQEWGGEVNAKGLDYVRGRGRADVDGLGLKVVAGKSEYRVGDGMKIGYKAADDCYYLLVHRNAQGAYTVISPDSGGRRKLEAGRNYTLPQGDDVIRVSEPRGTEELILIGAREPADLRNWREAVDDGRVAVAVAQYEVK